MPRRGSRGNGRRFVHVHRSHMGCALSHKAAAVTDGDQHSRRALGTLMSALVQMHRIPRWDTLGVSLRIRVSVGIARKVVTGVRFVPFSS